MITTDVQTLQHHVENWERVIVEYIETHKDNMLARNVVAQRNIGPTSGVDQVELHDRTEDWTEQVGIVAKGAVPSQTGYNARSVAWDIYQISTGWMLNRKDIAQDPKSKSRLADIGAKNISRFEDQFVLEGSSRQSINGLVDMGAANSNGTMVASGATGVNTNNKGAWSGETGTDIYDDILVSSDKLGPNFEADYLVSTKTIINYLNRLDSERQPYKMAVKDLFRQSDFTFKTGNFTTSTTNKAFIVSKDADGSEFVISENPKLQAYDMIQGQNFPFELYEWVAFEAHDNDSVVQIAVN